MKFRRRLWWWFAAALYVWFCLSYAIPDFVDATSPFPIQLRELMR